MAISDTLQESKLSRLGRWLSSFRGDLTGGLTAAVVALPLALAFAVASGDEPKAGLYTAIVAGIVAAIFGGSQSRLPDQRGQWPWSWWELLLNTGLRKFGLLE